MYVLTLSHWSNRMSEWAKWWKARLRVAFHVCSIVIYICECIVYSVQCTAYSYSSAVYCVIVCIAIALCGNLKWCSAIEWTWLSLPCAEEKNQKEKEKKRFGKNRNRQIFPVYWSTFHHNQSYFCIYLYGHFLFLLFASSSFNIVWQPPIVEYIKF